MIGMTTLFLPPMNLDTVQLRAFATVAALNGFSTASQQLGCKQSTVSKQVQKLETQLGHKLFVRESTGIRLTAKGIELLPHAINILAINDKAVSSLVH